MNEGSQGHDLRLVPPALGAWLASFALIPAGPGPSYLMAGACGAAATWLLLRPRALAAALRRGAIGTGPPGRGRAGHDPPGPGGGGAGLLRRGLPGAARHRRAVAGAVLACTAAAAAGVGLRLSAVGSGPLRELAARGAQVSLEAVITADPRSQAAQGGRVVTVRARAEALLGPRPVDIRVPVLVLAHGRSSPQWEVLLPSQRVRLTARLAPPRRPELLAAVAVVRGPPAVLGGPSAAQRAAGAVRAKLREATDDLPPAQRGVLPGMVVGDTTRLDPEIADDFKAAGLTHIMVVSGSNLAVIISAVLALARTAGLGRRSGPPIAAVAVLAFVVVARPDPSVLRALVMGLIGLLALAAGRRRHGVPALATAVLVLVLIDPELARSYGFALSVLATAGLLVLAPPWRDRLSRRMPRPMAEVLAVAAAAQIACAPVLVMLTGELSLVSIAANLLAAPAVPVATLLGALAAAVAPVAMPVARLVVRPAGLAAGWIVMVARNAAEVPHATLQWRDGLLGAVSLLLVMAAVVLVLHRRRLRRIGAAVCVGLLVTAVVMRIVLPGWPPAGWLFVACDVGQGDALVLATGRGRAVVVDAGPAPRLINRCLRDLGVTQVQMLVLTHPHADHVDGVPGVLRHRALGTVLPSPLSAGEERRLIPGLTVRPAAPGQTWAVGPLSLAVLAPAETGPHVSGRDPGTAVNNASVVLVARLHGLSLLLTGDIETDAQRALMGSVPPVDVFKVPHHGSSRQARDFVAASRARIAIISVGAGNTYGHPAPSTLALLRSLGMHGYRTDLDGDIAVLKTGGRAAVVTRGS